MSQPNIQVLLPLCLDDVVEEELDEVPCFESRPNFAVAAATIACEAAEAAAASLSRLEADPFPLTLPPLPSNSF